jgi:hypothetical protein
VPGIGNLLRLRREDVQAAREAGPRAAAQAGRSLIDIWTIEQLDEFLDRLPSRGDEAGAPGTPVRRLFNL